MAASEAIAVSRVNAGGGANGAGASGRSTRGNKSSTPDVMDFGSTLINAYNDMHYGSKPGAAASQTKSAPKGNSKTTDAENPQKSGGDAQQEAPSPTAQGPSPTSEAPHPPANDVNTPSGDTKKTEAVSPDGTQAVAVDQKVAQNGSASDGTTETGSEKPSGQLPVVSGQLTQAGTETQGTKSGTQNDPSAATAQVLPADVKAGDATSAASGKAKKSAVGPAQDVVVAKVEESAQAKDDGAGNEADSAPVVKDAGQGGQRRQGKVDVKPADAGAADESGNAGTPGTTPTAAGLADFASALVSANGGEKAASSGGTESRAEKPAAVPTAVVTIGGAASEVKKDSAAIAAPAQETPGAADAQNTFDQVVLGLRGKLDARNGKAEIRLDPPNLGALHVSLSLKNGSLTAEFSSGSDVVRELLRGNMDKLKSALEAQGVAVDKLAVQAMPEQGGTSSAGGGSLGQTNPDGSNGGGATGQQKQPGQQGTPEETFAKLWEDLQAKRPVDVMA